MRIAAYYIVRSPQPALLQSILRRTLPKASSSHAAGVVAAKGPWAARKACNDKTAAGVVATSLAHF